MVEDIFFRLLRARNNTIDNNTNNAKSSSASYSSGTIMLCIELRNLYSFYSCWENVRHIHTLKQIYTCIKENNVQIFYSIVGIHVYCLCVNVSMSCLKMKMIFFELHEVFDSFDNFICLNACTLNHFLFSCIEHPLWGYVFNFHWVKRPPSIKEFFYSFMQENVIVFSFTF